jgi:hypothetical protein
VPLSARAGDAEHTSATATRAATAGARAMDGGMAASPCPFTARSGPTVASWDADVRVGLRMAATSGVRAAPRAPSRRRSNDLLPRVPHGSHPSRSLLSWQRTSALREIQSPGASESRRSALQCSVSTSRALFRSGGPPV